MRSDARPRPRREGWSLWLLVALGLHVSVYALFSRARRSQATLSPATQRIDAPDLEIDVSELPREALDSEPESGVPADPPSGKVAASRLSPRGAVPLPSPPLGEPSTLEGRPGELSTPDAPSDASSGTELSLDALGVGEKNPFVGTDLARVKRPSPARPDATSRLRRSLAEEQLHADHSRGLGPEGPALRELERATRNGEVAVNSNALFRFTTDATGRVLRVELEESSSDPTPWRRVARRVLAAMGSQLLRVPKTGLGATFLVRVTSREAMPSGADPGLAVNLLGIPLQEGRGERSARIDLLDVVPELGISKIRLPSGETLEIPTVTLGRILNVQVDPADLGSPAQRVVHARVEKLGVTGEVAPEP